MLKKSGSYIAHCPDNYGSLVIELIDIEELQFYEVLVIKKSSAISPVRLP